MFIALATRVRGGPRASSLSTSLFGSEEHFFYPSPWGRFPTCLCFKRQVGNLPHGDEIVPQRCPAGYGAFLPGRDRDRPAAWTSDKSFSRVSTNEETTTSAP